MVKNHKLAKSISDAAWSQFAQWLEYFGKVYGKAVIAVPPQYTSQECSNCGDIVKKTLSTRTHICGCGTILDRDRNAGRNILAKGLKAHKEIDLNTVGHTGIHAGKPISTRWWRHQRANRLADPRILAPLGRGVSSIIIMSGRASAKTVRSTDFTLS